MSRLGSQLAIGKRKLSCGERLWPRGQPIAQGLGTLVESV